MSLTAVLLAFAAREHTARSRPRAPAPDFTRSCIMVAVAKFGIGEEVFVPATKLANPNAQSYALVRKTVLEQDNRSVVVDDGAGGRVSIASRLAHKPVGLGVLLLRLGDFGSEHTLLDPLATSVFQFLKMLIEDNDARYYGLRTLTELDHVWSREHGGCSHVVVIGHGTGKTGTKLAIVGDVGEISASDLAARLEGLAPDTAPKTFVSLCCWTGRAEFAKPFSHSAICSDFIGPRDDVHGAAASQFCQSFLSELFLDGREVPYAYNRAAQSAVGGRVFRRWRDGRLRPPPEGRARTSVANQV
jgi:hypothetical protein